MSDFDQIFRKYHNSLYLYANKFVRDEGVSFDIVQDVFALIWEKGKAELHDEHLKAYLFNSVKNSCLNYLKHEKIVQDHQQSHIERITQLEQKYYKSGEQSLIEKENLDKIQDLDANTIFYLISHCYDKVLLFFCYSVALQDIIDFKLVQPVLLLLHHLLLLRS